MGEVLEKPLNLVEILQVRFVFTCSAFADFFFWLCSYYKSGVFFFPLEFCDAEDTVFDASQYAFFGKDVVEEVELGGLEDEEDNLPAPAYDEEEFLFDKEEVYCFSGLLC